MQRTLAEVLSLELGTRRLPFLMTSKGANSFHLELSSGQVDYVLITAEDEALVVVIDGHTICRFGTYDYSHIREPMRKWHLAADVAQLLEELSSCRGDD